MWILSSCCNDPDIAHIEGQNDLPVISVLFTRRENVKISNAGTPVANLVSKAIRDIHDLEGPNSRPPFSNPNLT